MNNKFLTVNNNREFVYFKVFTKIKDLQFIFNFSLETTFFDSAIKGERSFELLRLLFISQFVSNKTHIAI